MPSATTTDYRSGSGAAMQVANNARDSAASANEAAAVAQKAADAAAKAAADAKAQADAAASMANRLAASVGVDLGVQVATFGGTLAIAAGVQTQTLTVPNAKVGDRVYIHPTKTTIKINNVDTVVSPPAGVLIQSTGYVPQDGQVQIWMLTPAIVALGVLRIPLRLVAQRPLT